MTSVLSEHTAPPEGIEDYASGSGLHRAASLVLKRAGDEYAGAPLGFIVADHHARVVTTQNATPAVGKAIDAAGVVRGVRLTEDAVGTNAIGTVLEAREPMLIRGHDHFLTAFQQFTCYGQPIIHPLTKRVEGVLNVGGGNDEDERYFGPVARRIAKDIEDLLVENSPVAQRRLLAAYHAAARRRDLPLMVLGEGLVLASPAALSLLDPTDHATVRAYADEIGSVSHRQRFTLTSGQEVDASCVPVEGTGGVLVNFTVIGHRSDPATAEVAFPLLVLGEPGTGRTSQARQVTTSANILDAADIRRNPQAWLDALEADTSGTGPALIIENVDLLTETEGTAVARLVGSSARPVVCTATIGGDTCTPAAIAGMCRSRIECVPLRFRRHEIPRLAGAMLTAAGSGSSVRFSAQTERVLAAQSWPGNLAELASVVQTVARTRSAGDIIPTDLPAGYRDVPAGLSPRQLVERDAIVAALDAVGGSKVKAAHTLGVSRATLYNRMRTLKIS